MRLKNDNVYNVSHIRVLYRRYSRHSRLTAKYMIPASCGHFPETDNLLPDKDIFIIYTENLLFIARLSETKSGFLRIAKMRTHSI